MHMCVHLSKTYALWAQMEGSALMLSTTTPAIMLLVMRGSIVNNVSLLPQGKLQHNSNKGKKNTKKEVQQKERKETKKKYRETDRQTDTERTRGKRRKKIERDGETD